MIAKRDEITYRDLYDLVDQKTGKIYDRLEIIENKVSSMEGQQKMATFVISTGIGVIFTIINFFMSLKPKS